MDPTIGLWDVVGVIIRGCVRSFCRSSVSSGEAYSLPWSASKVEVAACRAGDTLVVANQIAPRSLPDARAILEDRTTGDVKLSLGGSYPTSWRWSLNSNLTSSVRTGESMKGAKARGRLRGKQPKLHPRQEAPWVALHRAGNHSTAKLGDLFGVARATVYRAIERDARRAQGRTAARRSRHRSPVALRLGSRRQPARPLGPRDNLGLSERKRR